MTASVWLVACPSGVWLALVQLRLVPVQNLVVSVERGSLELGFWFVPLVYPSGLIALLSAVQGNYNLLPWLQADHIAVDASWIPLLRIGRLWLQTD